MSENRIVLRKGRARPLWFGHPWVYANAVAIGGRQARRRRRRVAGRPRRALHRPRLLQPALADPAAPVYAHRRSRRRRVLPQAASRAPAPPAPASVCPSADTNVYRLVQQRGRRSARAWWSTSTATPRSRRSRRWGCAQRRAEVYDALEAELRRTHDLRDRAARLRRPGGVRGAARASRAARRSPASPVIENGIRLEVEPLSGQKTGMFIDQRETRARVGSLARGARVLDCYAYAGGFGLAAARGGAAAVTAVDSSARAVARIEAHAAANGVDDRRPSRPTPSATWRRPRRVRSTWSSSTRRSSRAPARTSRRPARATNA